MTTRDSIIDYVMYTPQNSNRAVLNALFDAYDGGNNGNHYSRLIKVSNYLYEAWYDGLDYNTAIDYFETQNSPAPIGGCSAIRAENFYGRQFDWKYNNSAEFVIHTPRRNSRYKTVGMCGAIPQLTPEIVDSGELNAWYTVLPFFMQDGCNEWGLVANMNVVPMGEEETVSIPTGTTRDTICGTMLVRYILDNFMTARGAVDFIKEHVCVWFPKSLHDANYELHYMIADAFDSFVLEFVNNEVVIKEANYITNFIIDGVTTNSNGTVYTPYTQDETHNAVDTNGIAANGSGLERWNIIAETLGGIHNKNEMRALLNELMYTKTYTEINPAKVWYTEFAGINNLTCASPYTNYTSTLATAREKYAERTREDEEPLWQTVHSVIYDMSNKTLNVITQEDGVEWSFNI